MTANRPTPIYDSVAANLGAPGEPLRWLTGAEPSAPPPPPKPRTRKPRATKAKP